MKGSDKRTIKIGCNENYYPYIIINDSTGIPEGLIIDWWKIWAEKIGVEVEFIPLNIEECIEKASKGEIDIIGGLFYNEERVKILDFTESLLPMETVIFLKDGYNPNSIDQITDTLGVLKYDYAVLHFKKNYPKINLKIYDTDEELEERIINNSLQGFIYDIPNLSGNYKRVKAPKGYYPRAYHIYQVVYMERLRAAVKTGNKDMLDLIVAGASKISDRELKEIITANRVLHPDRSLLWIVLVVALVAGSFIALSVSYLIRKRLNKKDQADFETKTDWQLIISKGESDTIEFKSSLSYDYRLKRPNRILERAVVKTIAAFLNSTGGMLLIGVDDNGNVLGLDKDYSVLRKRNRDGFLLTITRIINFSLGKSIHKFIKMHIISINEKDICIVNVEESDKPIFMGKIDDERFYIRASASSQPLGVRETYNYIDSHWKKKKK